MEIDFYSKQQTDTKLDEKANNNDVYKKNETYSISETNNKIDEKLSEYQPDLNNYYSKSETDSLLSGKMNNGDAYSKSETDNLLLEKANASEVYPKTSTYTKNEVDNLLLPKANSSDVYTKTQTDNLVSPKANSSDVYTKTQVDNIINNLPVFAGLTRYNLGVNNITLPNTKEIRFNINNFSNGDIAIIRFSNANTGGDAVFIMTDNSSSRTVTASYLVGSNIKFYRLTSLGSGNYAITGKDYTFGGSVYDETMYSSSVIDGYVLKLGA